MSTCSVAEPSYAVQASSRTKPRLRRILIAVGVTLVVLLLAAYFGISAHTADRLAQPARNAVTGTPADYGLTYQDVQFNSALDNIKLSGWLIDLPGNKVIAMMHGKDQNRMRYEAILEKAFALYDHNYDLLMFDAFSPSTTSI